MKQGETRLNHLLREEERVKRIERRKCKIQTAVWLKKDQLEQQWKVLQVGGQEEGRGGGGETEPSVGRADAGVETGLVGAVTE